MHEYSKQFVLWNESVQQLKQQQTVETAAHGPAYVH